MTVAAAVRLSDELISPEASYFATSRALAKLDEAALDAFLHVAEQMPAPSMLMVHHAHEAATCVLAFQTAFVQRDEHLVIEIIGCWRTGNGADEHACVGATGRALDPHALPGGWANVMASDSERAELPSAPTRRGCARSSRWDPRSGVLGYPSGLSRSRRGSVGNGRRSSLGWRLSRRRPRRTRR